MLFEILKTFVQIGLYAIGGGLATVPYIRDFYTKHSMGGFTDSLSVAQSLPGPTGVNLSAYTGFVFGRGAAVGIFYSVTAAAAVVTVPVAVIFGVSGFMDVFRNNKYVVSAVKYLRPASAGLVAAAVFPVLLSTVFGNFKNINFSFVCLYAVCVSVYFKFKKIPVIAAVGAGAVFGIAAEYFGII